jgi:hypothetical protein
MFRSPLRLLCVDGSSSHVVAQQVPDVYPLAMATMACSA